MKILITGICGFVGSSLAYILSDNNEFDIYGVDKTIQEFDWNPRTSIETGLSECYEYAKTIIKV